MEQRDASPASRRAQDDSREAGCACLWVWRAGILGREMRVSQEKTYLQGLAALLDNVEQQQLARITGIIFGAYQRGNAIYACGNGGSAATASHWVVDMAKSINYGEGRPRYRALALTDNISMITAWANDTAYENIFAEQLRNFVREGDVLVAISASGQSANVLKAVELANAAGAITIGLAGYDGGKLKEIAQHCLVVPSFNMQHVEDAHLAICHAIFVALRDRKVS